MALWLRCRVELGRAYKRLGQHAHARQELEAALSMEVEDINAHLQKARSWAVALMGSCSWDCLDGGYSQGV